MSRELKARARYRERRLNGRGISGRRSSPRKCNPRRLFLRIVRESHAADRLRFFFFLLPLSPRGLYSRKSALSLSRYFTKLIVGALADTRDARRSKYIRCIISGPFSSLTGNCVGKDCAKEQRKSALSRIKRKLERDR